MAELPIELAHFSLLVQLPFELPLASLVEALVKVGQL